MIELLKDLKVAFEVITAQPAVTCKVFEHDQSYIVVAESRKPPARTKCISIKCHHFTHLVDKVVINIIYVETKKQNIDAFTKPIESNQLRATNSSS